MRWVPLVVEMIRTRRLISRVDPLSLEWADPLVKVGRSRDRHRLEVYRNIRRGKPITCTGRVVLAQFSGRPGEPVRESALKHGCNGM